MVLWCVIGLAALPCLGATVVVALRFRTSAAGPGPRDGGLSVVVPIKGVDAHTESNLDALFASHLTGPVEYLIAMESPDDPAHAVAVRVCQRHPDAASSIVVSGPAGTRMGKQHNLLAGFAQSRYDTIASMDADVMVRPDTLACGLANLERPDAGVAYFLPHYQGPGPIGGLLVALYSNYYYQLNMASLALSHNAPFITGGLWLMSAEARRRIGDLASFASTVSDDAAIGRAVVAAGLRTILVPRTVRIRYENLGPAAGARHVLKWLTLLRAEGLPTYLAIALSWHPVLVAVVAALIAVLAGVAPGPAALVVATVAGGVRLASGLVLHARAYGWRGAGAMVWLPAYEILAVPVLFSRGLVARELTWRGRRYRVGRGGVIESVSPVNRASAADRFGPQPP
jgi:ceramide glucosyltransferase